MFLWIDGENLNHKERDQWQSKVRTEMYGDIYIYIYMNPKLASCFTSPSYEERMIVIDCQVATTMKG